MVEIYDYSKLGWSVRYFKQCVGRGSVYGSHVFLLQFFLQLQQAAVSQGEQGVLGSLEMTEVGRLASLEGSLFDGLLSLLDRLKGDMLGRLLHFLMRDIADKAQPYCQER